METLSEAEGLENRRKFVAYLNSEHLWVQICVLKCFKNVGGVCNELCTRDCTCGARKGVVVTSGERRDGIVRLGRA